MPVETRIGDREREATVRALRDAYEAGRLDLAELESRVDAAWAGRTQPQLDGLRADLPAPGAPPRPAPAPARPAPGSGAATFAVAMLVMVGIWAATGAGHPWPLWVFLGWGPMVLLGRGRPHARRAPWACHGFRP